MHRDFRLNSFYIDSLILAKLWLHWWLVTELTHQINRTNLFVFTCHSFCWHPDQHVEYYGRKSFICSTKVCGWTKLSFGNIFTIKSLKWDLTQGWIFTMRGEMSQFQTGLRCFMLDYCQEEKHRFIQTYLLTHIRSEETSHPNIKSHNSGYETYLITHYNVDVNRHLSVIILSTTGTPLIRHPKVEVGV